MRIPLRSSIADLRPLVWSMVFAAAGLMCPNAAFAVARTCGANALTNTANVLCASPSGPCTSTNVTVSANIEVTTGGCDFDLGGRALRIEKTFQMTGLGFIKMRNAAAITITSAGKLKARGDFVQPNGYIEQGGVILLESSATISHDGIIDVSGDPGGAVDFHAAGGVTLEPGSLTQGNGITSFVFDGQRASDGGDIVLTSTAAAVLVEGNVSATGTQHGRGGVVLLQAARDVTVDQQIDASGGASDGGSILILSGDSVMVTAPMTVESRGGGGFGGDMLIEAGNDELGGLVTGGGVQVSGAALQLGGSSFEQFGGDGGELEILAHGHITFSGAGVAIRANAGSNFDGWGGIVTLDSQDEQPNTIGALDGDINLGGQLVANSGGSAGQGGFVTLRAGRHLTVNATANLTGKDGGGDLIAEAGGSTTLNGAISAYATSADGEPGFVDVRTGAAQQNGLLTVAADVLAYGGANSAEGQAITLSGCGLTVNNGIRIDGHADTAGGSAVTLISRVAMSLNANSQYLAHGAGSIETVHPSGQNPIIGSGVTFNPARIDTVVSTGPYEACPAP